MEENASQSNASHQEDAESAHKANHTSSSTCGGVGEWLENLPTVRCTQLLNSRLARLLSMSSSDRNQREETPNSQRPSTELQDTAQHQDVESGQDPDPSITWQASTACSSTTISNQRNSISNVGHQEDPTTEQAATSSVSSSLPEEIDEHVGSVLRRKRTRTKAEDDIVWRILRNLEGPVNTDKGANGDRAWLRDIFIDKDFIAGGTDYSKLLATSCGKRFDRRGLPSWCFPAVATPEPDICVGYSSGAFSRDEMETMQHPALQSYASPAPALFWPILAVQFDTCYGGSWMQKDQNATTGIQAINSLHKLLGYMKATPFDPLTDTIFFSCIVSRYGADLWVHWAKDSSKMSFCASNFRGYNFERPSHIRQFDADIQMIMDYATSERLTMIKQALLELSSNVSRLDDEENE